ncbi:MAG: DUF3857 and transglutaminase domain-containing protein [Pyrinomonadaceae bacterium]
MLSAVVFAGNDPQWKPISPAEMALKESSIEKDADAEAIFWEVYLADEADGGEPHTILQHYLRIKIFNERGREQFSKIDIPFGKISGVGVNIKIKNIAARTTKSDGSTVELKADDVFEREIVKGNGVKIKAKSFAMPGIEPGAIIEYRWKEIRGDTLSYYDRISFGREIPVENVTFHLKPLSIPGFPYGMRAQVFNGTNTPFAKEKAGFYSTSMTNVPSFKEEPQMPDEYAVRPWMLIYYSEDKKLDPQKFWKEHGKTVYENNKTGIKINDDVREATAKAVGDAATPEQKTERIFNYIRNNIKDVYDDVHNFSDADKKKVQENKTPAGTLKLGVGDGTDINRLFVAMLTAVGLEARITNLPSRSDIGFNINFTDDYFMRSTNVAVKLGDKWKFLDPAVRYMPYGMLSWEEEGQPVLISDPKEPIWSQTEASAPEQSLGKRTGKFKLLEDGTLEGEVQMEFTGHLAAYYKEYNDEDTPQQREETLKNLVKRNVLSSAELSDIRVENATDPEKPFVYAYKVRVPGYGTRTGKRIFLQPNFFERSSSPLFQSSTRRYDVQFQYSYEELDSITIELPAGYSLESPDVPGAVVDAQKIGLNEVKMTIKDNKTLIYERKFYFGKNGYLNFPAKSYTALKSLFEAYQKNDVHSLTIRQATTAANTVK